MTKWKLEDAKNGFSEVVRRARADGPQLVTRHGKDVVVVMSVEEYRELGGDEDLVEFLRNSPMAEAMAAGEFSIERPMDLGRDVALR